MDVLAETFNIGQKLYNWGIQEPGWKSNFVYAHAQLGSFKKKKKKKSKIFLYSPSIKKFTWKINLKFFILIQNLAPLIKKFTWQKFEMDEATWFIKIYLKKIENIFTFIHFSIFYSIFFYAQLLFLFYLLCLRYRNFYVVVDFVAFFLFLL